ncbi:MAG: copper chaperone PCu(A)C [Gallionellaceae bacterium]|nr:MAG: copper chaperone PCu(A)C [Gallionellaceae bacterium]
MFAKSLCALLLTLSANVWAGSNDVVVDKVWVGESVPGQNTATLELNITTVSAARLVSVSSAVADKVEIHSVSRHGGKMRAHVVDDLHLPPHRTTAFGSHRLFLVMAGLKQELNIGDRVPVSIVVEYAKQRRQTLAVEATVKKMELSYRHLGAGEVHDHR